MKSNFFKISLNGLEFNSKIGYHKQEQIDGNFFLVNLDLKIKRHKINDNLNMTVDYEKIYDLVKNIMSKKMKLIETVAESINNEVLSNFDLVYSSKVKIYKMNPKIDGKIESSSVTFENKRQNERL
tara:strand:+ start:91 stop:468 length:378 start_codon:yes stop_codon:yes gene_type:complete